MPVGPTSPYVPNAAPAAPHLYSDEAWEAALAARDAAPVTWTQDAVNALFVAARAAMLCGDHAEIGYHPGDRMTLDDVWRLALLHRNGRSQPSQAALQRGWRWANDTGLLRKGKHLASSRSFNVTPYYVWI